MQQFVLLLLESKFLQDPVVRVEEHGIRLRRAADEERLLGAGDVDPFLPDFVLRVQLDLHEGREERGEVLDLLLLFHREGNELCLVVVLPGDVELRVAPLEEPLIEELVEVSAGGLRDCLLEVVRLHIPQRVALDVVANPLPPQLIAEDEPHHVEHTGGLVVRVRVQHVFVVVVLRGDDRAAVRPRVLLEIPVRRFVHDPLELILAEFSLEPQRIEVRGEPLVQPEVVPRLRRDEVAEPLVRELVREQAFGSVVRTSVRVHEAVVDEHREGRVLHSSEGEVPHDRLRVLRPRVLHAGGLREERHHGGQVPERVVNLRALPLRDVVLEGDSLPRRLCAVELPAHDRDQIIHVRDVLKPVERSGLARRIALLVHEAAVRDRELRLIDGNDHLGGHPLVRGIVRWKPRTVVLLLALRPHHEGVLRVRLRGMYEEHPFARLAVVRNSQEELGVRLDRPREAHREPRTVVIEFEDPPLAVRDLPDMEAIPVQLDLAQSVVQRAQRQGRGPADLPLDLVESDIQPDVADAERAIPREVFRSGFLSEDAVGRSDVVCPAEEKGLRRTPPASRSSIESGRVI